MKNIKNQTVKSIAAFNRQLVQIHITGMSTSNLVFSLYLLLVEMITESHVLRNTLRYCLSVLIFLGGLPLYWHIAKKRAARLSEAKEGKNTGPMVARREKIARAVYFGVFRKKWYYLCLTFGLYIFIDIIC